MANRHYILKPTYTPAGSSENAGSPSSAEGSPAAGGAERGGSGAPTDANVRAENEDDDGYDPYSDRREERPLFEQDPWE